MEEHGKKMMILNDQGGSIMNVSEDVTATLRAQDHGHPPVACYPINLMVATRGGRDDMRTCFGIGEPDDPQFTLSSAHEHGVCYAIEGNTVDRASSKNGRGWCEDVSPTLNTQDRHAVVFALEGNGARPSHMGKGFSGDGLMYTLNTIEQHSVCYAVENHPNDSRCRIDPDGIVQTLSSRMGTGGNNTPFVLIVGEDE